MMSQRRNVVPLLIVAGVAIAASAMLYRRSRRRAASCHPPEGTTVSEEQRGASAASPPPLERSPTTTQSGTSLNAQPAKGAARRSISPGKLGVSPSPGSRSLSEICAADEHHIVQLMSGISDAIMQTGAAPVPASARVDELLTNLCNCLERQRASLFAASKAPRLTAEARRMKQHRAAEKFTAVYTANSSLERFLSKQGGRIAAAAETAKLLASAALGDQRRSIHNYTALLVAKTALRDPTVDSLQLSIELLSRAAESCSHEMLGLQRAPEDGRYIDFLPQPPSSDEVVSFVPFLDVPFYIGDVMFHLGEAFGLLRSCDNCEQLLDEVTRAQHPWLHIFSGCGAEEGDCDEATRLEKECMIAALAATGGNHASAWRDLALLLDGGERVSLPLASSTESAFVAGETECHIESIRCTGGAAGCKAADLWYNLAQLVPQGGTVSIPRAPVTFAVAHRSALEDVEVFSRRDCLARAVSIDSMAIPVAWFQLGQCLRRALVKRELDEGEGKSSEATVVTVDEERIVVQPLEGGNSMSVSSMDCFCLAIALLSPTEPSDASVLAATWYKVGLSLMDHITCSAHTARDPDSTYDTAAHHLDMHHVDCPPVTREDALLQTIRLRPADPKGWFSLGTSLYEREEAIMCLARAGERGSPEAYVALSKRLKTLLPATLLLTSDCDEDTVSIGWEEAFAEAQARSPRFEGMINEFLAKQQDKATN